VARPLACFFAVGVAIVAMLGFAAPAWAADEPNSITIEGAGLAAPITVQDAAQGDLFSRLLHQVSWMAGRGGDPMKPDPAKLGPKYRLTVYADDKATQRYDLYPQAAGGPKAFRPADQPKGKGADAWFYVSLSVPELMHAAGVPLIDPGATDSSGALVYRDPAGYIPAATNVDGHPLFSLGDVLHTQRRTLALWAGSAFAILLLVVGAARLSRRYSYDRR
jgi:hypothetical protein